MHREAVEEFLTAYTLSGESSETVAALKRAFAESGMPGYWRKALELEQEKAKHRYVSAYETAYSTPVWVRKSKLSSGWRKLTRSAPVPWSISRWIRASMASATTRASQTCCGAFISPDEA
jgi:hypothetical protein